FARPEVHTHRLDVAKAAVRKANRLRNLLGNADIRRAEIDVVRDEEFARADDSCPGGGMADGVAAIRGALGHHAHFFHQRFELAAANVFQIGAFGPAGGGLVEIDRDAKTRPDLVPDTFGQAYALLDGHAFDGDEWHHVGGADARMRALLLRQ